VARRSGRRTDEHSSVGKATHRQNAVQMQIAYAVYKDWDQVLENFTYNLAGILYHLDHGIPCRIMTRNKLHNRVPVMMLNDLRAHSNKPASDSSRKNM
jgi:hypothetical protein